MLTKYNLVNCPIQTMLDEESLKTNRIMHKSNKEEEIFNAALRSGIPISKLSVITKTEKYLSIYSFREWFFTYVKPR